MKFGFDYLIIFFVHVVLCVHATEIKWTAGDAAGSDAAKAPKSQKYWDEHGIKRPDYAKTDGELAAERGGHSHAVNFVNYAIALCFIGVGAFLYVRFVHSGGVKLGSANTGFSLHFLNVNAEDAREKARNARLQRFEATAQKQE